MMLNEYQTHSELNPKLWIDGELRPKLQQGFMKIAEKFHEFLDVPNTIIHDVILIGSNANYNWTKYSDIDLHVVINYMEVGDNLHIVKNYLQLKKTLWTHNYPLKYQDIPIELYAQDINEDLHSSVGIYSVAHSKWVSRPKADLVYIDDAAIQQKAAPFEFEITNLNTTHPNMEQRIREILLRLNRLRKTGLEAEGEYSVENLAFKHLRNKGLIDRLKELLNQGTFAQLQMESAAMSVKEAMLALAGHVSQDAVLDDSGWQQVIQHTGGIEDEMGQWAHPGRCTMIPSNRITMQDVPHKVLGIDDTGYMQLMQPDGQYEYPGGKVFEIPVMGSNRDLALQLLQRIRNAK